MSLFSVEGVSFHYPGQTSSLQEISFCVDRGERLALLGANGSGKSTLLHLLDGLYFPTEGRIAAFGHELTEAALERPPFGPLFRREVGFLFQNSEAQLFNPTVEDELAFGPLQIGWGPPVIRERTGEVLDLLEIAHLRKRAPQTLSAGEQKRVALASLLIVQPSVLLLDEPTAGLDPRSQYRLLELLDALSRRGMTLVTATHDMALVPDLADRALVIGEDHRLWKDGPVETVFSDRDLLIAANLIHPKLHSPLGRSVRIGDR